jgi:hypothetical protein
VIAVPIPSPFLIVLLAVPPVQEPVETPAAAVQAPVIAPEAQARWDALVAAAFPGGTAERLTSFDLDCWGTVYTGGNQTNDFEARIRFLEPGYVRRTMTQSGREQMRGPAGDFLVAKDGRGVPLQGREFREDKKELDRTVAVARTFLALTDPERLTIAGLELSATPPTSLPQAFAERANALEWLVLRSPDFYLADPAGAPAQAAAEARPLYRVQLGLDRGTHLPELVVVQRDAPGLVGSAQLVQLKKYETLDGHRVPFEVRTYDPDLATSPWRFAARPSSLLGLNAGSLKPGLKADDFAPPGR